jgi:isoamylase
MEDNKDGVSDNISFNCGYEGETSDPAIRELRKKIMKNFFVILMISQGVPLILGGDEFMRTQSGNNNAYCQDNNISYLDWTMAEANKEMVDFVRKLINFRKRHPHFWQENFFTGRDLDLDAIKDINWYSEDLKLPEWNSPEKGFLAFLIKGNELRGVSVEEKECDILVILNTLKEEKSFQLPRIHPGAVFSRIIDTSLPSGLDILEDQNAVQLPGHVYHPVAPQSVVILVSKSGGL